MDRFIPQVGAAPVVEDFLEPQVATMKAIGYLLQLVAGTGTVVDGLACSPATSGLGVVIGPGSITQYSVVDQNAYGTLPADSDPVVKFGINTQSESFTLAAPTTPGYSINYLVEASFLEADGTPVVEQYYNATNPSEPFSGPGGGGASVNTTRSQTVSLQLKAGVAASAGTQSTPVVDAGWSGLYVITVNAGAANIVSSNIQVFPGAPFLPNKLSGLRKPISDGILNLYVSPLGSDQALGTTPLTPLLTISKAVEMAASNYDLTGSQVVINLAEGTYLNAAVDGTQIKAPVYLAGAGSALTTITSSTQDSIQVRNGGQLYISGLKLTNTTPTAVDYSGGNCGILAITGGLLVIGEDIDFGSCTGHHMWSYSGGFITAQSQANGQGRDYTISGGAQLHAYASQSASIVLPDNTVTIENSPNFTTAFVLAEFCGAIQLYNVTYVGSATGQRYQVFACGSINTSGGGATYFPGTIAGSASANSSYN